jgi:hypothetical protein
VPVPVEITAVLGNESRKGPWVVPAHITVRSVRGDCHLEMQQAVIRQHVTTIDATGEPQAGAPVIVVNCDVFCGAVTVRRPDWIMRRQLGRQASRMTEDKET